MAGVYNEGDVMDLTCISVGGELLIKKKLAPTKAYCVILSRISGRPLPSVTWWVNGKLVDDTYHTESHDTRVNKLKHFTADRHLNGALLECRASNNNATSPQARILTIEINCKDFRRYILSICHKMCFFQCHLNESRSREYQNTSKPVKSTPLLAKWKVPDRNQK